MGETRTIGLRGAALALLSTLTMFSCGCSRTEYRLQADQEAYEAIQERNTDPRWAAADFDIEHDPRSRYFEPFDPDCTPMPPDDPASHQYMREVDGIEGWDYWDDFGTRSSLENPGWRDALGEYMDVDESGAVRLDVSSALQLAYIHSSSHQRQLETLYLSALDVTEERFRLDTQFFGGSDTVYNHNGKLVPASLQFDPGSGQYVVSPPFESVESNRLSVGRRGGSNSLEARRRFATAGDLLAGFANSFVVEFTGNNASLSASLANFAFIQPLLRGAGRDVALESLTFVERALLANLRAYRQFRQGFYTNVAIGELGVIGPQRRGGSTNLQSFSGFGGVGGYLGLLRQTQEIRNIQDNLNLLSRTLAQLEFRLEYGSIDLVQVDQFRQSVENEKARLLRETNDLELSLDRFKTGTLGLPPDLPVEIDDSLIRQFQFVSRDANAVLNSIIAVQRRVGELPDEPTLEQITELLPSAFDLIQPVRQQLAEVPMDIERMELVAPSRERLMDDDELETFREDRVQLRKKMSDLQQEFLSAPQQLQDLKDQLREETREQSFDGLIDWLRSIRRIVERSVLVQAGARLESVTVEDVDLQPEEAFTIALSNRLDFMNGRAALVDTWRLVQVRADALQSVLNVTASGDVRTAQNNPTSFRAPTSNLRLGLEFDAPITRVVERNDYREALINYQRDRRDYVESRDQLNQGLRALLRQLRQLRADLEIQRRAVTIAIRRVDLTQADLDAPVRPAQPGQRPTQFGPTAAFNLLSSTAALRDSQNSFLGVWLNYYATRMRLARELGVMQLDQEGQWANELLPGSEASDSEREELDQLIPELPPEAPVDQFGAGVHSPLPVSGLPVLGFEPVDNP